MSLVGKIFEIQHFALYDGPGVRTVIYLKGCPLRCLWCHNPEGQVFETQLLFHREHCIGCGICIPHCPSSARELTTCTVDRSICTACGSCIPYCSYGAPVISGKEVTVQEVLEEIIGDFHFFRNGGGVTFSGGEPLMQWEFVCALSKAAKQHGIHTCIETCGFASEDAVKQTAAVTDMFLFDIKELNPDRHRKMTGVDNHQILSNLRLLNSMHSRVILRCPIVPSQNCYRDHFIGIAELAQELECVEAIEIEPYHPLGLSKYAALDMKPRFCLQEFLDPSTLREYVDIMAEITQKPIRLSNGETIK